MPNYYNEVVMKGIKKALTVAASAFISVCFFVGCAKPVKVSTGELMQDMDVKPTQTAYYEQYTKQAIGEYYAVADKHRNEYGEIDFENEEVASVSKTVSAKLFAYACYNERTLDKYVFFSHQEGETNISSGSGVAIKQEYFLRVNEQEGVTCGYRYHYTIKKVEECSGLIKTAKSSFESARTRITDETDLLYRLEGSNIRTGARNEAFGVEILECDWKTGSDWGKHDVVMKKSEPIAPEDIRADIEEHAGEDNITIRANINILADNIVQSATIIEDDNGGYMVIMIIDTKVANNDIASLKMLRKANGSDDCEWVGGEDSSEEDDSSGLVIVYRIWDNGLFRTYSIGEKWRGKILTFSGTAESSTVYYYSYSDRDCDMTGYLKMLEEAKEAKGD